MDGLNFLEVKYICPSWENISLVLNYVIGLRGRFFGTTYCCESLYSTIKFVKSKHRSQLTNQHRTKFLRTALSNFKPNFKNLTKNCLHARLIKRIQATPADAARHTERSIRMHILPPYRRCLDPFNQSSLQTIFGQIFKIWLQIS